MRNEGLAEHDQVVVFLFQRVHQCCILQRFQRCRHPYRLELALDRACQQAVLGVFGAKRQPQLQRFARQQLPGPVGIVGQRGFVFQRIIAIGRRKEGLACFGVDPQQRRNQFADVQAVADRLPDCQFLQRRAIDVEKHDFRCLAKSFFHFQFRITAQPGCGSQRLPQTDQVDRPGFQRHCPRIGITNHLEHQFFILRAAAPITWVAFQHKLLVFLPAFQTVRPGADRLYHFACCIDAAWPDDGQEGNGQVRCKGKGRFVHHDLYYVFTARLNRGHVHQPDLAGTCPQSFQVLLDHRRGQRRTVMEFYPLAQRKCPRLAIRRHRPSLRQRGNQFEIGVQFDQAVENERADKRRHRRSRVIAAQICVFADHDLLRRRCSR